MGTGDFRLSLCWWRKKMIVRPEMIRRIEIHFVIEYEKNAKQLINVPRMQGTILHVRNFPDWHLRNDNTAKIPSKMKRASFNGTATSMTENWQYRWKRYQDKLWTDDKFQSNNENLAMKASADGAALSNSIDACMKHITVNKRKELCLTVHNCFNITQNNSFEWNDHGQIWTDI